MKNYKQWQNKQRYLEFVGPAGQIDPQGSMMPSAAPASPMSDAAPASPLEELGGVGHMMQRLLKSLSTKPAMQIMQAQQAFDSEIQALLQDRSPAAARRSALQNFNAFRQMKQNVGKPMQQPQIPG